MCIIVPDYVAEQNIYHKKAWLLIGAESSRTCTTLDYFYRIKVVLYELATRTWLCNFALAPKPFIAQCDPQGLVSEAFGLGSGCLRFAAM
ncbi:hypothetical protein KCU85_g236, partial [Aureobasidium melanogenum]